MEVSLSIGVLPLGKKRAERSTAPCFLPGYTPGRRLLVMPATGSMIQVIKFGGGL